MCFCLYMCVCVGVYVGGGGVYSVEKKSISSLTTKTHKINDNNNYNTANGIQSNKRRIYVFDSSMWAWTTTM